MYFHQAPTTFVGQVDLIVSNLDRSSQFYQKIIGLRPLKQTANSVTFTTDGKRPLLTITQPNHVTRRLQPAAGLYHFALLLPTRADLANIVHHFVQIGLPLGAGDHLVSEAVYFNDPDGNGIEIYADRNPKTWKWQNKEVEMTTLAVNFDDLMKELTTTNWQKLPEQTVMGHLHLQVADLQKNKEFYVDGLGFDIVSQYAPRALFTSDNQYHHHIAFNTWAGTDIAKPLSNQIGLAGYTLIYADETKRQAALTGLEKIGVTVTKANADWQAFDPSGNRVLLKIGQ